jgi:dTDP-4-dehydrorhamnose 3,5-epimerase
MPFEFEELKISGVVLVKPRLFPDDRGYFFETYKRSEFSLAGINENFVQDNYSVSSKSVIRGLHYQKEPKAQAKLVSATVGKIFDVAVDMRRNSPTYGDWVAAELSEENRHMMFIPSGCAHGFCVLSDNAEVSYKASDEYSPSHEAGVIWNDPDLNVQWPVGAPVLSDKDLELPSFRDADNNFTYGDKPR